MRPARWYWLAAAILTSYKLFTTPPGPARDTIGGFNLLVCGLAMESVFRKEDR